MSETEASKRPLTYEKDAGWIYGPEAACRLIAAVSWPREREENRDAWAVTMLDRPDLLATEIASARARLERAIACVTSEAMTA